MKHKVSELGDGVKPRLRRDRGSWVAEAPGFRAYDATPWKAWFRLRVLVARRGCSTTHPEAMKP